MSIVIERLTESNLAEAITINNLALPEHYDYPTWLSYINDFPEGCLIAKVDGKIVGYMLGKVSDSVLYGSALGGPTKVGHIVSIAIHPDNRRGGVGKRLLTEAINVLIARGCNGVMLQVRVSNTPAIGLYQKFGFKTASVVSRYYQDGEAAYVMYRGLLPMSSIT